MRAKIKNSLSVKVFLWIAGSLLFCSFLIYGCILVFLPKSYVAVSSEYINAEIDKLVETCLRPDLRTQKVNLKSFVKRIRLRS